MHADPRETIEGRPVHYQFDIVEKLRAAADVVEWFDARELIS